MTSLTVHFRLYYLTVIEGVSWRDQDYTSNKIIKCVKGEPINGSFSIQFRGKNVSFNEKNRGEFLDILYGDLAGGITAKITGEFCLVPIPNSTVTASTREGFRTAERAMKISERIGDRANTATALVWKQAHKSSRRGGLRDPQAHYDNLRILEMPRSPIVLFDDVMTSGAHLRAAYRRLRDAGNAPVAALVVGKATRDQPENMIGWSTEELIIDDRPAVW